MPLAIISGQPCSGKSTIAAKLAQMFAAAGLQVDLVDEPSLHLERNTSYSTSVNEKNTRGKLKSTVEKMVSKKTVTILDSINNIKGYRYELWCVARAAGTRYCMIHVDTPVDTCRQWNEAREEGYNAEVFNDLAGRFERPDSKNRWDAPLFTIAPGSDNVEEVLQAIVDALTETPKANPQQQLAKTLTPTMATTNPSLSATNVLHELDQAAQDIINKIMEAQISSGGGPAGVVDINQSTPPLQLSTAITLAELRRHKRSFLRLATKITFTRLQDSSRAQIMFADYLRENLQSS